MIIIKRKKFSKISNSLFIFLVIFFTFISIFNEASAHTSKKHKPMVCILEEDRTKQQKQNCKTLLFFHRLCKLDQDCAILELEKRKKELENKEQEIQAKEDEIKELEDEIGGLADCGDIPFNHKASSSAKIYQKPSSNSKVVAEVKKSQELLFFAPAQKDPKWSYVKVKKDNSCADGYIKQKFVIKKESEDKVVKVGPKLIKITDPVLSDDEKLMIIDAEGTISVSGAIQDGKIDKIMINDEEEIINSDNSFSFVIFVPKSGAEVRIIGSKNDKKIKELIFKIKVGM
tara:strand:+ start:95 stop:955 length:861 start_codon:yes stop_codon:yes gene_type:complete